MRPAAVAQLRMTTSNPWQKFMGVPDSPPFHRKTALTENAGRHIPSHCVFSCLKESVTGMLLFLGCR